MYWNGGQKRKEGLFGMEVFTDIPLKAKLDGTLVACNIHDQRSNRISPLSEKVSTI